MKESQITIDICHWLQSEGVNVETVNTEGYYNVNKGMYQKRSSPYARNGSSDIHATLPPYGQGLYIEVKMPSEMTFFDRIASDARDRLIDATKRNLSRAMLKKYQHSLDQSEYIEEKKSMGAIAFFASSIEQVKERLKELGIINYILT